MRIVISDEELRKRLQDRMNATVNGQLLAEFIDYLEADLPQWIQDNLKSFELKLVEERRI